MITAQTYALVQNTYKLETSTLERGGKNPNYRLTCWILLVNVMFILCAQGSVILIKLRAVQHFVFTGIKKM